MAELFGRSSYHYLLVFFCFRVYLTEISNVELTTVAKLLTDSVTMARTHVVKQERKTGRKQKVAKQKYCNTSDVYRNGRKNNFSLSRRLLSKAKNTAQKARLQTKYDALSNIISIDFSNQEIQDLQRAVLELLTKFKDKINEREVFRISRIQPCGSMVEKTAAWKYSGSHNPITLIPERIALNQYIEFDYLSVLEKASSSFCLSDGCRLCMKVNYSPVIDDYVNQSIFSHFSGCQKFELAFWDILQSVVLSCDCMQKVATDIEEDCRHRKHKHREVVLQAVKGCERCTVETPSGKLQFGNAMIDAATSLLFLWTSNSLSLHGPDQDAFPSHVSHKTQCIKYLPVYVDFIPSFELSKSKTADNESQHDCFIVSKKCVSDACDFSWRISGCLAEIDHIVNKMSDKHRKCFKILKYFNQQERKYYDVPAYHLKTLVQNHSLTCRETSNKYQPCLNAILRELEQAYDSRNLKSFNSRENLFKELKRYSRQDYQCNLGKLRVVMQIFISEALV